MKKLLSILMLLVAIVTGASAATDGYTTDAIKLSSGGSHTDLASTSNNFKLSAATVGSSSNGMRIAAPNSFTITANSGITIDEIELVTNQSGRQFSNNLNVEGVKKGSSGDAAKTYIYTFTTSPTAVTFTNANGTSSNNIDVVSISITYTTGGSSKTPVTLSFNPTSANATMGQGFTEPTLSTNVEGTLSHARYSSSTPGVATVNAETGEVTLVAEGSTTISATIPSSDESYSSNTASYTLTVAAAGPTYKAFTDGEIVWTSKADVDGYITAGWMKKGTNLDGTKDLGNRSLIDPEDESQTITKYDSSTAFYMENTLTNNQDRALYLYVTGVSSMSFYVWNNSSDGRSYTIRVNGTDVKSVNFISGKPASYSTITLNPTANNTIAFYGSNQVELYAVKGMTAKKETVAIGAGGYSTFAADENYTVSGATVLAATNKANSVTLSEVNGSTVIPAGTGIILKGTQGGNATITYTNDAEGTVTTDMVGVTEANQFNPSDNNSVYVIATKNNETKFYKYTGDSFPLGKAYLNAAANTDALDIDFDSATAVEAIAEANANSAAPIKVIKNGKLYIGNYNVAGQQVK